jgi:hypothetical protein
MVLENRFYIPVQGNKLRIKWASYHYGMVHPRVFVEETASQYGIYC